MKLSTKSRYAITAMLSLAIKDNQGPVTLTDISNCQKISLSYLEQLFSLLRKSDLVQGVRGPGGGYCLAKRPNLISVSDIINAVEESSGNKNDHTNCKKGSECLTNQLWNQLSDQLMGFLDSMTLADFVSSHEIPKTQFHLDETTRRISSMFPVSDSMRVA